MKQLILGAAGFIGTNLAMELAREDGAELTLFARVEGPVRGERVTWVTGSFDRAADFAALVRGHRVVYHLISTTCPTNSNLHIAQEMEENVVTTCRLLDACVAEGVAKVVFLSSGGTVYGVESSMPLHEDLPAEPISSYGIQKVTIEKLLYLYYYQNGLDYRIIRLANPYGPYQRPDGRQGVVTTFAYRALRGEPLQMYGDGSVVRDYIYIADAVRGILNITRSTPGERLFNLGGGGGCSIAQLIGTLERVLGRPVQVERLPGRPVDVPRNVLDLTRYEREFGPLDPIPLEEGIAKTLDFLRKQYDL